MITFANIYQQTFRADSVSYNKRYTPPMPQAESVYAARDIKNANTDKKTKREEKIDRNFFRVGVGAIALLAAAFSGILVMEILKHRLNKKAMKINVEQFKRQFPDQQEQKNIQDTLIDMTKDNSIPDLDSKSINPKVKKFIKENIESLKVDKEIRDYTGAKYPPRMLLLWGGTGTGKTYTAKIFAKAQGAQYAEVQFSDLSSTFVGETAVRITEKFNQFAKLAKENPNNKYVLTFNEIDSLITNVDNVGENTAHYMQNRTSFLNGLDSIKDIPNLTIIGTTNVNPNTAKLDAATLNRFGNVIEIALPTKDELKAALKWHLRDSKAVQEKDFFKKDKEINKFLEELVQKKCSQRDLENIVNIALNKFNIDAGKKGKPKAFTMEFSIKYLKDALKEKEFIVNDLKSNNKSTKIEFPDVSFWKAIKLRLSGWATKSNSAT